MKSTDWVEDTNEHEWIDNSKERKFMYYMSSVKRAIYGKFEVFNRQYPYCQETPVYYWVTCDSVVLFKFMAINHYEHVSISSEGGLIIYCGYSGNIHCYTNKYMKYEGIGYLSNFMNKYNRSLNASDFIVTRNYIYYKKSVLFDSADTYSISIYNHDFTYIDGIVYDNARIMVNDKYIIALKLHSNTTECYLYDHDMRQIAHIVAKKNASRAKKFIVDDEKSKIILLTGGGKPICVQLPFIQ